MRANVRTSRVPATRRQDPRCNVPCFRTEVVARLRDALPDPPVVSEVSTHFAALADPARVRIVHALSGGEELCVCDVAHVLGTSISTASHHLRRLRDIGILQFRNDGKMAYYSIRDRKLAELVALSVRQVKR